MSRSRVQGLAEAAAIFEAIPTAAQQEMVVELGIIGRDVLKIQQQHVPIKTAALLGGLSLAVLVDKMRFRGGLINPAIAPFYGRMVEFGRTAKTVTRRRPRGSLGPPSRKRAANVAGTMRVGATPARPFVDPPNIDLEALATARLADYWSNVLSRAGA